MEQRKPILGTDAIRINVEFITELKYWAEKFGVSRDEIKSAVKEAGDSLTAVTRHLDSALYA
ncbi:DUF3606 domain-containing protein [Pseudomonas sp. ANT_J12]|uniref:DUF3606 domain-containing protein n=1 Tax=Pseudomonas sp. ANT_J12 TaxID=2597351 RepID=UPI0011F3E9F6|nr:DUF3606 domain-containing protein [Pseudomonas sp. ANT_J12]KAA0986277.1 DUF3606 domain-containing protein [Pseudomonas sp. ANT_J12]